MTRQLHTANCELQTGGSFKLPPDGWYQIAPLGEFPHSASGVVQVVDTASCASMVNRFADEAKARNFAGLLIDFDHFSLDDKLKSEAAGWITALENRDDGLYAQIRWSDVGEECVKGGRYRFLSPVWSRSDCEDLGNGRVRPVRLLNAAVTNDPNLKGMVPLSNRNQAAGGSGQDFPAEDALSPEDAELLENIGWSDAARAASIAVRRAKAAARKAAAEKAGEGGASVDPDSGGGDTEPDTDGDDPSAADDLEWFQEKGLSVMTPEAIDRLTAQLREKLRHGAPLEPAEEDFLQRRVEAGYAGESEADPVFSWMERRATDPPSSELSHPRSLLGDDPIARDPAASVEADKLRRRLAAARNG